MIICTNCGFQNDDDDRFCGQCQEYLDWTGTTSSVGEDLDVEQDTDEPAGADDIDKGVIERLVEHFGRDGGQPDDVEARRDEGVDSEHDSASAGVARAPDPASLTDETVARVEREAEEAADREEEARALAEDRAATADRARREAEAAEKAREEAAQAARAEAERLEQLQATVAEDGHDDATREPVVPPESRDRTTTDDAVEGTHDESATRADEAADDQAPADVSGESQDEAPEDAPDHGSDVSVDTSRHGDGAQAEIAAAEDALQQAKDEQRARAAEAEAARREAEAAAEAEAEAARRAEEEARAAELARRAAALVARPPTTAEDRTSDAADRGASSSSGPGPSRPAQRRPARRSRRSDRSDADDQPADEDRDQTPKGPGAVRPSASQVWRRSTRPPIAPRRLRPGDLVCGNCGEGNRPDRNFCRRCGGELAESEVVRLPWWRRVFRRGPKSAPPAGTRPQGRSRRDLGKSARGARRGVMGALGTVGRILVVLAIAGGVLGVALVPNLRQAAGDRVSAVYTSIRRVVAPEYVPITPTGVTASSEQANHPAEHAIDNISNRWWSEDAGPDAQARLLIEFGEPVDVAAFGITPGAAEPDQYVAQPRPRRLHLVFSNGTTMDVSVVDEHEFQSFDVDDADQVTSVEIQITEEWLGQSESDDVAITTIEFRTLR